MKKSVLKFASAFLFSIAAAFAAFGQQVKMSAFAVKSSTLLEDVRNLRAQNPKWTPEELAENADKLLAPQDFNYTFDFDESVCRKIADARKNPKFACRRRSPFPKTAKFSFSNCPSPN